MGKIPFVLFVFALLVCALSTSITAPPMPFIVYGHVEWNSQMLSGSRLQLTNIETGYTETVTTDSCGYWQNDAGNFMTAGQTLKVKILDGCGTADVCEKTVKFDKDYAIVDFSITGILSCPPCVCNCGGGSCSCTYTEEKCRDKYPCKGCETIDCPSKVCPACPSVDCPVCVDKTCPACEECADKECPSPNCGGIWIIVIVASIIFAVGGFITGKYTK